MSMFQDVFLVVADRQQISCEQLVVIACFAKRACQGKKNNCMLSIQMAMYLVVSFHAMVRSAASIASPSVRL